MTKQEIDAIKLKAVLETPLFTSAKHAIGFGQTSMLMSSAAFAEGNTGMAIFHAERTAIAINAANLCFEAE